MSGWTYVTHARARGGPPGGVTGDPMNRRRYPRAGGYSAGQECHSLPRRCAPRCATEAERCAAGTTSAASTGMSRVVTAFSVVLWLIAPVAIASAAPAASTVQ